MNHDDYCPCPYPDLPHPVTESNLWHAKQREAARARNESGQFISNAEEQWNQIPDAQKKLLGYRKPRKPKAKRRR